MIVTADMFFEQVKLLYKTQTHGVLGSPLYYVEKLVTENIQKIRDQNLWIGITMSVTTGIVGIALIPVDMARDDTSAIFTSPNALIRLLQH